MPLTVEECRIHSERAHDGLTEGHLAARALSRLRKEHADRNERVSLLLRKIATQFESQLPGTVAARNLFEIACVLRNLSDRDREDVRLSDASAREIAACIESADSLSGGFELNRKAKRRARLTHAPAAAA